MRRFFCFSKNIYNNQIIIDDAAELHHIKNVSRLKVNDSLCIFDESGREYQCSIDSFTNDSVRLKIIKQLKKDKSPHVDLSVACAIAKGKRFDNVLEKLTELGVTRIIPVKTKRTIPQIDLKAQKKNSRWMKVILAACKQSFRIDIPELTAVKALKDVCSLKGDFDLKLIAFKREGSVPILKVLEGNSFSSVVVLIGPEGDFTESEVTQAEQHGFIPVSLGNNILRVDTASIYASSVIISYANS